MVEINVKWNSVRENLFLKNDTKKKKKSIGRLPSKSMSFLSTKVVLKYMDAHQRLQLVHRCPTTRLIDQKIPLYIHKLSLLPTKISVNNFEYEVGPDPRPLLKIYETWNRDMFWRFSPDQEIPAAQDDELTPGDVKIGEIEEVRAPRINFRNRQEETPHIIRKPYVFMINGKVQENFRRPQVPSTAMKYLTTKLFAGRPCLNVHKLSVCMDGGVLRLPSLLRLRIRNLATSKNLFAVLEALEPLLERTSFPLRSIELVDNFQLYRTSIYGNSQVDSAKTLIFNKWCSLTMAQVCDLENERVVLRENRFDVGDFLWLASEWTRLIRDYGTYYEFGDLSDELVKQVIKCFLSQTVIYQKKTEGCSEFIRKKLAIYQKKTDRCSEFSETVVFQVNSALKTFAIRATCEKTLNEDRTWTLGMEVVNPEDFVARL